MNSSVYWEKRIANKTWGIYNDIEKRNKALIEFYEECSEDIQFELFKISKKIKSNAPTLTDMHQYNRLSKLNKNIESKIKDLSKRVEKGFKEDITKGYQENYDITMKAIGELEYSTPSEKMIEELVKYPWSGENFSNRLWENTRILERNLNEIMVRGLVQGQTIVEIATELDNRMKKGYNEAHRLVRTETMHYLNESSIQAYKDADIEKIQFLAALDERTCPECGGEHGKRYKIDKAPILPLHPNCRCTYIPVIEIEDNSGSNNKDSGIIEESEIGFTNNVKGNMSDEAQEILENILNNAPEDVKNLWAKVQDDLVMVDANSKKSYYRHGEGVYYDFKKDSINEKSMIEGRLHKGKANYTTFFHEYGHHIDSLFGYDDSYQMRYRSVVTKKYVTQDVKVWNYKSKELGLSNSLKEELKDTIKNFGAKNIEDLAERLYDYAEDNYSYGYNGASDILSGLTGDKVHMGWHHSKKYWKDKKDTDGLGKEAFAHMFSAYTMQGDADKFMKEVFPKSYSKVIDFIKEASK
ncbi:minor capsid protein [Clostridium sp. D2Q-14]|uniref:minor capsid protein n=1 Tax=Anaeromonas gelatinilytica TaxID=2683194 RepID=UPI00193C81E5|nr:minor capsid protein [Anaeromonas gelatinilytica]MBS4535824.1 minor capsid protein [Anaeromonas gelatinilytica]